MCLFPALHVQYLEEGYTLERILAIEYVRPRLKPQMVTEWISNLRKVMVVSSAAVVSSAK